VYRQRRITCRACGIGTERMEFADAKARITRRLRQQIGVDCQSMPTRQRLPEMNRLGEFVLKHVDGIAAYCDHPIRFGVVESINTTIKVCFDAPVACAIS
jgi:transposase